MKTLLFALTFLFSISLAEAGLGTGKTKRSALTKKVTYSGEKKYKKSKGKRVVITKKMFAGENIR